MPASAVPATPKKTNGAKGKKGKGNSAPASAKKRKVEEMSGDESQENGLMKDEAENDNAWGSAKHT